MLFFNVANTCNKTDKPYLYHSSIFSKDIFSLFKKFCNIREYMSLQFAEMESSKTMYFLWFSGHRVLLFCQMTRMRDILEVYVFLEGYDLCRLDGITAHSERTVSISVPTYYLELNLWKFEDSGQGYL